VALELGKVKIIPEVKKRWFNLRWGLAFNVPLTALFFPFFAEYQDVWHGTHKSIFPMRFDEVLECLFLALVFAMASYFLVGDGWVYWQSKKRKE
jgi:hypothetical protein